MARVNLDGKVWKDPRVKRLAKRLAWSLQETVGTLAAVWDVAYDNKTPTMPRIDVDTAADADGFADAMLAEDLATSGGVGADVRLRGVTERIAYLLTQAERGRLGGLAKASAKRTEGTFLADAKQTPGERQAPAYHSGALPLAPDLSLSPDLGIPILAGFGPAPAEPERKQVKPRKKPAGPLPADWTPTPQHRDLARERDADLEMEARRFRAHAEANARVAVVWNAAFTQWLLKAEPPRLRAVSGGLDVIRSIPEL